jgi:hypothetical protein
MSLNHEEANPPIAINGYLEAHVICVWRVNGTEREIGEVSGGLRAAFVTQIGWGTEKIQEGP